MSDVYSGQVIDHAMMLNDEPEDVVVQQVKKELPPPPPLKAGLVDYKLKSKSEFRSVTSRHR